MNWKTDLKDFSTLVDSFIDAAGIPGFLLLFYLGAQFTLKSFENSIIVFIISFTLNFILKKIFKKERSKKTKFAFDYAFPSNHAQQSFLLVTWFTLTYNSLLAFLLYATASFVAYSRVRFGVHDTQDVLAGALTGIVLGLIFILIL